MTANMLNKDPFTDTHGNSLNVVPITSTVDFRTVDINYARPSRLGWLLLAVGFGGFMLWAAFAPLDQGVPASGQVVVTGNRKAVQNLSPGMVEEILVKDGDVVKAGDVLVRLDATSAHSQYEMARSQWLVAKAMEARLIADAQGKTGIAFPDVLVNEKADARAINTMAVQSHLLRARQAGLQAELGAMKNTLAGLEAYVAGLSAARRSKEEQWNSVREELSGLRKLASEGYFPRIRLSEYERMMAQLSGAMSEDWGNIGRAQQNIGEIRMRMLARQQDYRKEVETGLSEVQKEASSLDSRIKALAFELANTEVKASSEGVVVGLNIHTVGGVIPSGFSLMELVPKNESLKVDVQIPTALIDKVKVGLPVEILFPAFNQATTPHIAGEFVQVAADATSDPQGRTPPFYKGQVVVTPDGMKKLKTHEIKAGMPAEVLIKTGERTLLNYLFKPIIDRMRSALTEE